MNSQRILIGVAGWSYPDWRGIFYPRSRSKGSSDLGLIARLFDTVEINSTFYRQPETRLSESWLGAVEAVADFVFTAKVPKDLTHRGHVDASTLHGACSRFREGLAPLSEANRLALVLAQFPPSFHDGTESRNRIRALVESLRPLETAIEIRHASFFSKGQKTELDFLPFLERLGASFVNVDLPPGRGNPPPSVINTSGQAYVRLHGRNVETWFDPRSGRDQRYDYLYDAEELAPWASRIDTLAGRSERVYAILNNHFHAQAPANAFQLMRLVGRELPSLPSSLVAAYPALAPGQPAAAASKGRLQ